MDGRTDGRADGRTDGRTDKLIRVELGNLFGSSSSKSCLGVCVVIHHRLHSLRVGWSLAMFLDFCEEKFLIHDSRGRGFMILKNN
jgi:hypothetical protein